MMQCSQCGAELQDSFQFCPECGHPQALPHDLAEPTPTVVDVPSDGGWILAVMSGASQGASYSLADKLVIGREPACDVILDDDRASRRHATIERTGEDSFRLVDHGSTNGTFVNEQKIEGSAILFAGTPFRIGSTLMALVPTGETCAACGQPIDASIAYCGNCGHPVGTEAEIDLDQLAARFAGAAASTPSTSREDVAIEASKLVNETGDRLKALTANVPRRWLGIGCAILFVLLATTVCCGYLYTVILDL
jgi:hypothetical protein